MEIDPDKALGATAEPPRKRISVSLTDTEFEAIHELARQCQTSPSKLGQVAYQQLLVQARSGALPMVAPSTIERAEKHPKFGYDPRTASVIELKGVMRTSPGSGV